MKSNKVPFLLFLFVLVLSLIVMLYTYLEKQSELSSQPEPSNQLKPLSLKLNINCIEFVSDGYDENGNWVSMGSGAEISLDGRLHYDSPTVSNLKTVTAKITVSNVATKTQLNDELIINIDPNGVSFFSKELVTQEQVEMPSCTDYKYGVAFYSPEGELIPHEGDLENSIEIK